MDFKCGWQGVDKVLLDEMVIDGWIFNADGRVWLRCGC